MKQKTECGCDRCKRGAVAEISYRGGKAHIHPTPTCSDCQRAEVDPGCPAVHCYKDGSGDPGYPPEARCLLSYERQESFEEALGVDFDARHCSKFLPNTIDHCFECKEKMDVPNTHGGTGEKTSFQVNGIRYAATSAL